MFNRQQRRFGYLMLIIVVPMLALAGDSITRPKRDTNIIVVALQRQPQAAE